MDKIEFIAPYSLEECRQRLESQNQKFKLLYIFTFDWQTRKKIVITPLDETTYQFTIKKIQKKDFTPWSEWIYPNLRGTLQAQSPESTTVSARAEIPVLFGTMGCVGLVALLIWSSLTVGAFSAQYNAIGTVMGGLIAGMAMWLYYEKAMYDKRDLFQLLSETLKAE